MLRGLLVLVVLAVVVTAGVVVLGSGGDDDDAAVAPPTSSTPALTTSDPRATAPTPALRPARCRADGARNCTAVIGSVIAIESVDADGDGDLHVIAAGGEVTAPGITVFDVSAKLRPKEDPRPGDRVTGAGPVYRGRFGQRQIEVTEFRVARR